jgi:hypothetical protein
MAFAEHKGTYDLGNIVTYNYSSGTSYGYRLVKYIWVNEIGDYTWIATPVKIRNNEVIEYTNGSFELVSDKTIKAEYPSKWTKDPEFKKGDILVGTDKKSGKKLIFVYLANDHVERLTPRPDMMMPDQFGYSTLSDYSTNFGPLTVHKTQGYSQGNHVKFSDL